MNFFSKIQILIKNPYDPSLERVATNILWFGAIRFAAFGILCSLILGGLLLIDSQRIVGTPSTGLQVETISREKLGSTIEALGQQSLTYQALLR